MPNNIKNRLEIIGTEKQVNEVLDFLRGEPSEEGFEMFIDFGKIIPMPESLNISRNSWVMPLENQFSANIKMKAHIDEIKEFCEKNPSRKEQTINNFIAGIKNYIEYGHATWYNWSVANWGTKLNAYQQEKQESNAIMFETAWAGVPDLINKLSVKFPEVSFTYKWSDEDTGYNCGIGSYKNGELEINCPENCSREAYELAFELRPHYKEDYKLVGDTYECIDED
jgi:hypothetical protein